jgi:hypothetical protein
MDGKGNTHTNRCKYKIHTSCPTTSLVPNSSVLLHLQPTMVPNLRGSIWQRQTLAGSSHSRNCASFFGTLLGKKGLDLYIYIYGVGSKWKWRYHMHIYTSIREDRIEIGNKWTVEIKARQLAPGYRMGAKKPAEVAALAESRVRVETACVKYFGTPRSKRWVMRITVGMRLVTVRIFFFHVFLWAPLISRMPPAVARCQ